MTFRMKPEYDRKGSASASAGSVATIIVRLPTDKGKLHQSEFQKGTPGHTPPPFFTKG